MEVTPILSIPIPDAEGDALRPQLYQQAMALDTIIQEAVDTGEGLENPMTTLGDIIYGEASGVATRRGGNVSTIQKFLTSTGDGILATPPVWSPLPDLSGTYQLVHENLTAISTLINAAGWLHNDGAGVFTYSTPNAFDIGLGNVTNDAQLKIASNLSDLANAGTARTNLGVTIGSNVQAWDADLDAIAALAGTTGLARKTAANTWALDTNTYATQAYADALVLGLLDDRGNYDASVNTFPASGGSGSAGTILKGDLWTISVAGTLGGHPVTAGDVVRALADTPGQTDANWSIGENNFGYVALNQALADGKIYVGNGSGIGTAVTPSGDVTISNAGVTAIGASKVTNAMLAGSIDLATKVTGILPTTSFPALTGDVTTSVGSVITAIGTSKVTATMLNSNVFANPIASIGLTAVNGSAGTAMRSDASPALSVSINPTWSGNHTFTGAVIFHTSGNQIDPLINYDQNLGQLSKKYLSIHAAELWVETIVAQDTMATMGGRLVIPKGTTLLSADLVAAATTITVKHNNLTSGDRIWLESGGKFEMMAVTSSAGGSAGVYTYTVTRNLDGTGANDWFAGDGVINTGTTGDGFIELYAYSGRFAGTGPTIVGNVRTGTTYNQIEPHWAIGNLNGLYGYGVTTYGAAFGVPTAAWIKIDAINGVRLGFNTTTNVQIDGSGNASFAGSITAVAGSVGGFDIGVNYIRDTNNQFGLSSVESGGSGVHFWAGSTFANRATAPFRITDDGSLFASAGIIAEWSVTSTALTNDEVKIAAGVDPAFSAGVGEAWFGKSAVGYYGLLLKGTTTAHVFLAAGHPSVGSNGRPYFAVSDGTIYRVAIGELNYAWGSDGATNSMGMKIWDSAGTKLIEFSDVQNIIGGFTVGSDYLRDAANSFGLASTVTGGDDVRFWAGSTFANRASAPFRLTEAGNFFASNATITGAVTMSSGSITGPLTMSGAGASIAIGATPPTSATVGTGIWIDRTGMYGLASNVQQAIFDAATGKITAGAGNVVLDANGLGITHTGTQTLDSIRFLRSGTIFAQIWGGASASGAEWRTFVTDPASNGTTNAGIWTAHTGVDQQLNFELENRADISSSYAMLGGHSTFRGIRIDNNHWSLVSTGPSGFLDLRYREGTTSALLDMLRLSHNSTGTPAANFGTSILFKLESATTEDRDAARIGTLWTTATDASRTSAFVIQTVNNAAALAEVVRFAGNGDATFTGLLKAGSGPTTLTDSAGKILSASLNTVAVPQGGTNKTSWTAGSIAFAASSTALGEDNSNLFWDDTNNRLGVGTAAPAYNLEVAKNQNASTYLVVTNTDNTNSTSRSRFAAIAGTVTMEFQAIATAGGYFGTSSNHEIVFYTNGGTRLVIGNTGAIQFAAYGAGTLVTDASGNITASSDERLKIVRGEFTRGLKELLQIKPILYSWNEKSKMETKSVYPGYTTQNIKKFIPEAVFDSPSGYQNLYERGINATVVISVQQLVKAILDAKSLESLQKNVQQYLS